MAVKNAFESMNATQLGTVLRSWVSATDINGIGEDEADEYRERIKQVIRAMTIDKKLVTDTNIANLGKVQGRLPKK